MREWMLSKRWPPQVVAGMLAGVLAVVAFGCGGRAKKNRLELKVSVGSAWKERAPQIAAWVVDDKGDILVPVYVTRWSAEHFNAVESFQDLPRPEALPVFQWALYSTGRRDAVDIVSGASRKSSFEHRIELPKGLAPGRYHVWVEINQSFNYNAFYRRDLPVEDPAFNATSGQPSVVWHGEMVPDDRPVRVELVYAGHGHPVGNHGGLVPGGNHLTTALELVESVVVTYNPAIATRK